MNDGVSDGGDNLINSGIKEACEKDDGEKIRTALQQLGVSDPDVRTRHMLEFLIGIKRDKNGTADNCHALQEAV